MKRIKLSTILIVLGWSIMCALMLTISISLSQNYAETHHEFPKIMYSPFVGNILN